VVRNLYDCLILGKYRKSGIPEDGMPDD